MIAYLDSSSLVKLYIDEAESDDVQRLVDISDLVSTSMVAFAETRAAFARLRREGRITPAQLESCRAAFDLRWSRMSAVVVDDQLARRAGALAERYALRGFDSIHLASYLDVAQRAAPASVTFSSFDVRLDRAAAAALRTLRRRRY